MPKTKQHKAASRQLILASAGLLFRRDGVASASVGGVMAQAGLTHGGFYAHFESKDALLAEVVAHDHGFIRQLARREPGSPAAWRRGTLQVFADYLNPAHLDVVASGCTFAALTGEAAHAAAPVREGYRQAWQQLLGEVLRGPEVSPQRAFTQASASQRQAAAALVALAIGSVAIARVLAPDPAAATLLRGALAQVREMLIM